MWLHSPKKFRNKSRPNLFVISESSRATAYTDKVLQGQRPQMTCDPVYRMIYFKRLVYEISQTRK